jgi:hypothetical protein
MIDLVEELVIGRPVRHCREMYNGIALLEVRRPVEWLREVRQESGADVLPASGRRTRRRDHLESSLDKIGDEVADEAI